MCVPTIAYELNDLSNRYLARWFILTLSRSSSRSRAKVNAHRRNPRLRALAIYNVISELNKISTRQRLAIFAAELADPFVDSARNSDRDVEMYVLCVASHSL